MECHGNGEDHCCYVLGEPCQFLEVDTVPGRHWVCGLRRELGDWSLVHIDPRYVDGVQVHWKANNPPVADCGDWRENQCCFVTQVEVRL